MDLGKPDLDMQNTLNKTNTNPLVSICRLAHNHEPYMH